MNDDQGLDKREALATHLSIVHGICTNVYALLEARREARCKKVKLEAIAPDVKVLLDMITSLKAGMAVVLGVEVCDVCGEVHDDDSAPKPPISDGRH